MVAVYVPGVFVLRVATTVHGKAVQVGALRSGAANVPVETAVKATDVPERIPGQPF
jgi:hypothetical protein